MKRRPGFGEQHRKLVSALRDAALIVNGNHVEHYEIATYGSLAAFAKHLELHEAVALLEQTLKEEKTADPS